MTGAAILILAGCALVAIVLWLRRTISAGKQPKQ